jgi:hypothetical protein
MRAIGKRSLAQLFEGTMTPEEIEQWPAMRARALRVIVQSVLMKGPLFGLGITAVFIGAAALLRHQFAGDTLDFGWFQVPGRAGAAIFSAHTHFWNFLPWAVIVGSFFLLLVGTGAWVTCETEFRRYAKSAEQDSES